MKHLRPPTQVPGYEPRKFLGAGAYGEVWVAVDKTTGRQVAIKVLPGHLAADTSARERLRREAVSAAALDHPFICKVFEIGEERGVLFLVMEFVTGDTLYQRLPLGDLATTGSIADFGRSGRSVGGSASQPIRSSRSEAGQRDVDGGRPREGDGLRAGQKVRDSGAGRG